MRSLENVLIQFSPYTTVSVLVWDTGKSCFIAFQEVTISDVLNHDFFERNKNFITTHYFSEDILYLHVWRFEGEVITK